MKKTFSRIVAFAIAFVMLLGVVPVSVFAAEEKPIAITVSSQTGCPGDTVQVKISLDNNTGLTGLQLDIAYDEMLLLTNVEINSDFGGAMIETSNPYKNPQTLTMISPLAENTTNGVLATFSFTIAEDAPNNYNANIVVTPTEAYNDSGDIALTVINGSITVYHGLPGDINEDSKVDTKDAILLFRYVAGWDVDVDTAALDVNGDNKITTKDAVMLFRYAAGWEDIILYYGETCTHDLIHSVAKEATCTEDGQIEFWYCELCGRIYSDDAGKTQTSRQDVTIPEKGHTEVIDEEVLPTYASTGLSRGSHCSICGVVIIPQEVTGPLTKDEYTIQYVCDMVPLDENGVPQIIPNDTYRPSETKTLYAPKMDTYKFLGWSDKDGKMYGLEIPRGTAKDLVLYANWVSDRNKAEPVAKLGDPIICEDSDAGQIIFVYEIGTIKNIPLFETQDLLVANGIITSQGTVKQTSISKSNAEEIGKVIANTTTNSSTWTFASDWNNVISVNEEWAAQQGMSVEEAEEFCKNESNGYNVVNSSGGSSSFVKSDNSYFRVTGNQAHTDSTYSDEQRYAGLNINGKVSNSTTASAGVSAGITVPLGPAVATGKAEANLSNTTAFEIGASYDQKKYTQDIKTGTNSWSNSIDMSNTSSQTSTSAKTWNSTEGFNASNSTSASEAISKAVSELISQKNSKDSSYTTGGEQGEAKEYASSNANEDKYSSTVTYSEAQINIAERTFTSTGHTYGSYRLVQTGSAHVFAVVAYDIKNKAYYTYTYSVLDDDEYKEYLDYSYDRTFNDYETSTLPFEIPIFVNDYVNSRITASKLQISDEGIVTKYLGGADEDVVLIPSYYTRINSVTGEAEMIKIVGLAEGLFKNNTSIVGVSLGNFINEIPASTFEGCTSLKEVVCPNVLRIGDYAFKGCTSLSTFSLPNEIESIGKEVFSGVPALKSNAPTIEIANIVANSNAQNIILDISKINATDFGGLIINVAAIESFKLIGGYKEYKGLNIKSQAKTTVVSGVKIPETDTVPMRVSSENLTLERVTLCGKEFALILEANETVLSIEGVSNIVSEGTNSILAKGICFVQNNEETYSVIQTVGNILLCGSVSNNNEYIDVEKVVTITEDEYYNYLTSKKITFDANGGTVSTTQMTVSYNNPIGTLPTPTKANFNFAGWFTAASGGTQITSNYVVNVNQTLYAHWTPKTFTLYYNANEGYVSTSSKTLTYGNSLGSLPTPTKDYHNFIGWYDANGNTVSESTVPESATDITIYAHWELKPTYWVKASEAPAGAQIVDRKYSYRETTSSDSSSLSGWIHYDTSSAWSDYGAWSVWQDDSVSASDSRQVEEQTVEATAGYYEYRYGRRHNSSHWTFCQHGQKSGLSYTTKYSDWSTTRIYDKDGKTNWSCSICDQKFYEYNIGTQIYYWEESRYIEPTYKTQYRYRDRSLVYTYYFYRDVESTTAPSGSNISNVQEWVCYRPK